MCGADIFLLGLLIFAFSHSFAGEFIGSLLMILGALK